MLRAQMLVAGLAVAGLLSACSGSSDQARAHSSSSPSKTFSPTTVTLLTYDAFALSQKVLDDFKARTGISLKVVPGGDAA